MIVQEVSRLLTDEVIYTQMSRSINPYGTGDSCKNIIHAFEQFI
jgi:UDP-N-acetylglucosamine 2-epimerase